MKFEPQTAIKTDLHTFTLGVSHFLAPFMRYISFNYSSLDRFRQAILGSYMVNVGLCPAAFAQQIHVQTISKRRIQCMGKCECGRLKGNPCGPLRPNTINVTMLDSVPRTLILLLLNSARSCLPLAAPVEGMLEKALQVERWIDSVKIESEEGLAWPFDPARPQVVTKLYSGTPGIVLFYLELYRSTGEPAYLETAKQGAFYLSH